MRSYHARAMLALTLSVLSACTASRPAAPVDRFAIPPDLKDEVLFDGDVQQIAPLHDGDVFTVRVTGNKALADGIYTQHVRCERATTCSITLRQADNEVSRNIIQIGDNARYMLSAELVQAGLRMTYETPLPSANIPLRSRRDPVDTAVRVSMLSNDQEVMARGAIKQLRWARRLPDTDGTRFELHRISTVDLGANHTRTEEVSEVTLGIGTVRSTETADDGSTFTIELLCATVAGKQLGSCPE